MQTAIFLTKWSDESIIFIIDVISKHEKLTELSCDGFIFT
jgi:hypothetical protein